MEVEGEEAMKTHNLLTHGQFSLPLMQYIS